MIKLQNLFAALVNMGIFQAERYPYLLMQQTNFEIPFMRNIYAFVAFTKKN